jgi:biopolymer transport protein ExbD
MQFQNNIQFGLLAILLALASFFFMLNTNETGLEVHRAAQGSTTRNCGDIKVTIHANGSFIHNHQTWGMDNLVKHIAVDYHEQPFSRIDVIADENVSHATVVALSSRVKRVLPDVILNWESFSLSSKEINE